MPSPQLGLKLCGRIYRGIHFSRKRPLGRAERRNDFFEANASDHEQVHVASLALFPAGSGAIDEGRSDPRGKRRQSGSQYFDDARCLQDQPLQLAKNRTLRVRPVIDLHSRDFAAENSRGHKLLRFAAHGSCAASGCAGDLAEIVRAAHMAEQQSQNCSARAPEERGRQCRRKRACTHYEYECTQF